MRSPIFTPAAAASARTSNGKPALVSADDLPAAAAGGDHAARVHEVLARVYQRKGHTAVEHRTPLSALLDVEDMADLLHQGQEEEERELIREARLRTFELLIGWIFGDGWHPLAVLKRVYLLARAYKPRLIGEMNGTDLADIFNEERATQSARAKRLLNRLFARGGFRPRSVGFQRGADTCAALAAASAGNCNRQGGKRLREKLEA